MYDTIACIGPELEDLDWHAQDSDSDSAYSVQTESLSEDHGPVQTSHREEDNATSLR